MSTARFILAALAALATTAQARPAIEGVTVIIAARPSGGSSARAGEPEAVAKLMAELNAEQAKNWRPFHAKLGACAVRLTLYAGDERLARYVIDADMLVAYDGTSATSGLFREVGRYDLRAIRHLAAKVQDPKVCKK